MRSLVKALVVAVLGCILIAMATALIRRSVVLKQIDKASRQIEDGQFSEAETVLDRYEEWTVYYPAIHQQLLCRLTKSKVRRGNTESGMAFAESIRLSHPPTFRDTLKSVGAFFHYGPDWVIAAISGDSQTWDPDAGYQALLDELLKAQKYKELVKAAEKLLEEDPENSTAKAMIALAKNNGQASNPVETEPEPTPEVVITPTEATPPLGTSVEIESTKPRDPTEDELRARATELMTLLKARRKTLTASRPPTEAERTRDALQRRYNAMRDQAIKIEEEMNRSTGQKRANALDRARRMKGDMVRCQNDLKRAEEAASAADVRRKTAIANDPEVKSLEKELADVKTKLQHP